MKIKPFDFVQEIFHLDGSKLRLPKATMKHLIPIYNDPSDEVLLMFGRQTHKSTSLSINNMYPGLLIPHYRTLYIAPTGQQVSVYSSDKIDPLLKHSPIVKRRFINSKTAYQVYYKEFANGSKNYFRSMFLSPDSIRGISADLTLFDEVQDLIYDHIPVAQQCMSHSMEHGNLIREKIPWAPPHMFFRSIYAGTPKTMENTLTRFWDKSNQTEYVIRCEHCNKWNYIDEKNIGLKQLICRFCGKPIYYHNGTWVQTQQNGILSGYRMPQIVLPWINNVDNPDRWDKNVIKTQIKYSGEKYYNEVLALPYANAKHPLSRSHMISCAMPDMQMADPDKGVSSVGLIPTMINCVAGIDWGKGDTASGTSYSVLTIGGYVQGKFTVFYMKRYVGKEMSDALIQIKDMVKIIRRFECKRVIADTGDGRTANAEMVKALGAKKFSEVYEHGSQKKLINWDTKTGKFIISRTQMMQNCFMEIRREQVRFFHRDGLEQFITDFTGIYGEYSESTRMTKFDHNTPDDAFHSYMFARIAAGLIRGEYNSYIGGGENEPSAEQNVHRVDHGITVK